MRDFTKVSPSLWRSRRFQDLPTDDARYLYVYLLTNEHQSIAGMYRLPDGYACDDLGWDDPRYIEARDHLESADMIRFDASTSEVLITRWFKHNPPMGEKHFKGIENVLGRLESMELCEEALAEAEKAWREREEHRTAEQIKRANAGNVSNIQDRLGGTKFLNRGGG